MFFFFWKNRQVYIEGKTEEDLKEQKSTRKSHERQQQEI